MAITIFSCALENKNKKSFVMRCLLILLCLFASLCNASVSLSNYGTITTVSSSYGESMVVRGSVDNSAPSVINDAHYEFMAFLIEQARPDTGTTTQVFKAGISVASILLSFGSNYRVNVADPDAQLIGYCVERAQGEANVNNMHTSFGDPYKILNRLVNNGGRSYHILLQDHFDGDVSSEALFTTLDYFTLLSDSLYASSNGVIIRHIDTNLQQVSVLPELYKNNLFGTAITFSYGSHVFIVVRQQGITCQDMADVSVQYPASECVDY